MPAAASQAGGLPAQGAHAVQFLGASGTAIEMPSLHLAPRQRQGVAALLISQPEVTAGLLPLGAMCRNAPPPGPEMGQQMGEFMTQSAVHFVGTELPQAWIESDQRLAGQSRSRGAAHARIPTNTNPGGEGVALQVAEKMTGVSFEVGGTAG